MQGLERLINSNTETMKSLVQNLRKRKLSPSVHHSSSKPAKLTKPAKVPTWTKDMSLKTYVKQLTTWQQINEDIPEFGKFQKEQGDKGITQIFGRTYSSCD